MAAPCRLGGYLCAGAIWLVAGAFALMASVRAAESYSRDAVEAAYLYRFCAYVEWPRSPGPSRPFVIALLDAPTVAGELRRIVPGHLIRGQPIEIREASRPGELRGASIVFVGSGHADSLLGMWAELAASSTLIVTEQEDGLDAGAALNFLTIDHRVRFEVSLTAAERSHLKISSDLLAVAVRVIGGVRQSRKAGFEWPGRGQGAGSRRQRSVA